MSAPPVRPRGAAHTIVIACTAALTLAYLTLVVLSGPGPAPVMWAFAWAIAMIPIAQWAFRLTGGRVVRRTSELTLGLLIVIGLINGSFQPNAPLADFAVMVATPVLVCYTAYRVMRRVRIGSAASVSRDARAVGVEFAGVVVGAAVIAAVLAPDFRFGARVYREPRPEFAANHIGCYAFQIGYQRPEWLPGPSADRYPSRPVRIGLDTAGDLRVWSTEFPTSASLGSPLSADSVVVRIGGGHVGRRMYLGRSGDGYTGYIVHYDDMHMLAMPSARVRARPVSCDSVPTDSPRA